MRQAALLAVFISLAIVGRAQPGADPRDQSTCITDPARVKRLEMLADLWGKLYLFHPAITANGLPWDIVLRDAIPEVECANTAQDLAAVINRTVLSHLNDPFAHAQVASAKIPNPAGPSHRRLADGVGFLDFRNPTNYFTRGFYDHLARAIDELSDSRYLVVDLRMSAANDDMDFYIFNWMRCWIVEPVAISPVAVRAHHGWNETNEMITSYLRQYWKVEQGYVLEPLTTLDRTTRHLVSDPKRFPSITRPTLFLVNNTSYPFVYRTLDVLQRKGHAVVWEQTGRWASDMTTRKHLLRYPQGIEIHFNPELLLSASGPTGLHPTLSRRDEILETELPALATSILSKMSSGSRTPASAPSMSFPVTTGSSAPELSRALRLAGLFKIWTVMKYLGPHVNLAREPWETVLPEYIPRIEAATSLPAYYEELERFTALLNDGHVKIQHSVPTPSVRPVPLMLRRVEGKVIVLLVGEYQNGTRPDVRVGDEVLAIDGVSVDEIQKKELARISSGRPEELWRSFTFQPMGRGEAAVTLDIRGVDQGVRAVVVNRGGTLKVPTGRANILPLEMTVKAGALRVPANLRKPEMPEGIAYVDAESMGPSRRNDTLVRMEKSRGIILDLRTRPPNVDLHWFLPQYPLAIQDWPVLTGHEPDARSWWTRHRPPRVAPSDTKSLQQPLVALIDETFLSNEEGFCMPLRFARRATFVGTATGGANGGTSFINLPGGGRMQFTAVRLSYPDGSRFQNVGIVPDVPVESTIEGRLEFRDEVLEVGLRTILNMTAQK